MSRQVQVRVLVVLVAALGCDGSGSIEQGPGSDSTQRQVVAPGRFTTFEAGQVRPLALAPSGQFLYAVNTPDDRLEVFRVRKGSLTKTASVGVGMEPVAVACRTDTECWVVNHLSDSVSIVDTSIEQAPRVVRTLLVGDEPRDIVFAGPNRSRAFITTAHRGQNSPVDPQLTTPGVGRADVFVFDANNLGSSVGGTPLTVLTLFADTPRALAASADGSTVYAAAFYSGNQTTVIAEGTVVANGGLPPPNTITVPGLGTIPQPGTGLIVKFKNGHWVDNIGRPWDAFVNLNLPDKDVFAINANATPPVQSRLWTGVGTTLFNLAVNPVSGKVYVSNTDARNDVRFEGHGNALPGTGDKTVRGHLAESRITVLDGSGARARHLNKHINYNVDFTAGEKEKSLAFPQSMAVSANGATLYVSAFGSAKIGVFSTAELEADSFVPDASKQVALSAGGPTGLALDERNGAVYVLTRFDNGISIVDTTTRSEIQHVKMYNPEPPVVVNGRRFLYDANYTSSHGDSACASCHIFGDMDHLSWDLGNPDGFPLPIPNNYAIPPAIILQLLPFVQGVFAGFQPLKGPMTTQSLRGMDNHGAMHWRGDRNGGFDAARNPIASVQPNGGSFSENAAFNAFNVAFPGLVGRGAQLDPAEMQAFTDFILEVSYPPNPIRSLDNSLTAQQQAGHDFFFNHLANGTPLPSDRFFNCAGCHILNPTANAEFGVAHPGFFGTDGKFTFENETQIFKIPHLRNMYQKVGMFGMAPEPSSPLEQVPGFIHPMGDQVRGFGFQHDGAFDTIDHFLTLFVFMKTTSPTPNPGGPTFPDIPPNPFGIPFGDEGLGLRRAIESFVLVFDSNLAPIVGQQVTLTSANAQVAGDRITLLETRAALGECDLVVRGRVLRDTGWLFKDGKFQTDVSAVPALSDSQMRAVANVTPLTFTCTPPGTGVRLGLDRDGDGFADGDEIIAGTDPANPASHR